MSVSIEKKGVLERSMIISISPEALAQAFEKRLLKMAPTVQMPGFRKGKVPPSLIRQQHGESVRREVLGELVQASVGETLQKEKLIPAATPEVELRPVSPGAHLEFVATFEVVPEVTAVNFSPEEIERETAVVTEADIDKTLDRLRHQHADWTDADRAAAKGDRVTVNFVGTIEDKPFSGGTAENFSLLLGEGRMISGFEEGIVGMQVAERKTLTLTFPETYHAPEVAGKTAQFDLELIRIAAPVLPALDADFARRLGIASGEMTDLKAEITRHLTAALQQATRNRLKQRVFDLLLEQNSMEVPRVMVARETARLHEQTHAHPSGGACHHTPEEKASLEQTAEKNVLLGLLLTALVRLHALKVDPDRMEKRLAELAAAYETPHEMVRWYQDNPKAMEDIRMQLLEDEIVDKLLEGVRVTEKQLSCTDILDRAS